MQQISTLKYVATTQNGSDRVATQVCDFTVDSTWQINPTGTDINGDGVAPRFMIIDNVANNGIVQTTYGPFSFSIPPYTRRTFQLPDIVSSVTVVGSVGAVSVTFTEKATDVPDEINYQAVQKSVVTNLFPFVVITATRNQSVSDAGCQIVFSAAAPITYFMIAASGFQNGAINPVFTNKGTAPVFVVPAGIDSINGIFTNANYMTLSPGDSITLGTDGNTWYAEGELTYETSELAANAVGVLSANHGLRIKPKEIEVYWRCKNADIGYSPGDEIPVSGLPANGQNNTQQHSPCVADATNFYLIRGGWNGTPQIPRKDTGVQGNMTTANWALFARLRAKV